MNDDADHKEMHVNAVCANHFSSLICNNISIYSSAYQDIRTHQLCSIDYLHGGHIHPVMPHFRQQTVI